MKAINALMVGGGAAMPGREQPVVSLRAKLLLGTLLMLIPVLGLLLIAFNASYDRRREIVLESLLQTARGAAALVDATFDEAITLGQAIAGDPAIQSLDPAVVTPRLRRLGSGYDQYQTFFVFDTSGELIGVSDTDVPEPLNIADRSYFQHVVQTGQSTSFELMLGRLSGGASTGVAIPIFEAADTPVGVLVIGFDLERLQERIASMGVAGTQSVSLFDPGGRLALVAAERPVAMARSWDQRDFSALPEIQAALTGDTVLRTDFTSALDARPLAVAVVRSRHHGWVAAAAWPAEEAFAPANEARLRELATFAGIVVASLFGTAVLASSLTRPVRQLAQGALAFGRGELDHRLDIGSGDELGQLGQAFNTMAVQIQATLVELDAARAAAERAVRVRDEFLASASHELRTPISHVKGFVSSLRQTDVEWDEEVRQDFLAEIERETDRLAKLIGDLLDMTRLESGGLDEIDRAPVRPVELVHGGLDRVRGLLRRHVVQVDVPVDLPPVFGEVSQLERMIANLAENAAKFSPAGSSIRISGAPADGVVALCVEDEGPGIPVDRLEQVFEKFYRGRHGATPVPGTGLGLSICRRIVEAHGGRIWAARSERGARFVVELPTAARVVGVER